MKDVMERACGMLIGIAIAGAFLLGWEWSAYIAHKDVSQFGTQLQCTQSGDVRK